MGDDFSLILVLAEETVRSLLTRAHNGEDPDELMSDVLLSASYHSLSE